jgi:hypothetical protein
MLLSKDDLNRLATYAEWFVLARDRFPSNWGELAEYLDEERSHGRFPDANAVRVVEGLSRWHEFQERFDELQDHYHALVKIGEVRPATGWMVAP